MAAAVHVVVAGSAAVLWHLLRIGGVAATIGTGLAAAVSAGPGPDIAPRGAPQKYERVNGDEQQIAATPPPPQEAEGESDLEENDNVDTPEAEEEDKEETEALGEQPTDGEAESDGESNLCPALSDPNGGWEGSRAVNGEYSLICAPGFQVSGSASARKPRTNDTPSVLICPENLHWDQGLSCSNINDCVSLKHGCGAFGVCVDRVNRYDCNCEEGLHRRRGDDGEIVCGGEADQCDGHTCGPFGICIDLGREYRELAAGPNENEEETVSKSWSIRGLKSAASLYKCECNDGYSDNGTTCVPLDCGEMHDEIGTWSGSTLFGGEYTLKCPESGATNSYIWGGTLRQITRSCPARGSWHSQPFCISPTQQAIDRGLEAVERWGCLAMALLCIVCAAFASGLTVGLVSVEPFSLRVILHTRTEDCANEEERCNLRRDKGYLRVILPLIGKRNERHVLLVTLMLFNTLANEALPICIDELTNPIIAVLLSVTVVLFVGEILPSAVFTGPWRWRIASFFVQPVCVLKRVFYPVAKPVAMVLDRVIPEDGGGDSGDTKYSRAELRALLHFHATGEDSSSPHSHEPSLDHSVSSTEMLNDSAIHSGLAQSPVLSIPEERIIERVLALQKIYVWKVRFARAEECIIAAPNDLAVNVVARGAFRCNFRARARAVLVADLASDTSGSPPMMISRHAVVPAEAIKGVLRPQDVLGAGRDQVIDLCPGPPVLLEKHLSALDALHRLRGRRLGVVVDKGQTEDALARHVVGVISQLDILMLLCGESVAEDQRTSSKPLPPLRAGTVGDVAAYSPHSFQYRGLVGRRVANFTRTGTKGVQAVEQGDYTLLDNRSFVQASNGRARTAMM